MSISLKYEPGFNVHHTRLDLRPTRTPVEDAGTTVQLCSNYAGFVIIYISTFMDVEFVLAALL